ncbi:ankyrin repeat domain-containing protein 13C-like, partial [Symsagittifera roscoffensis]|uniref:ankyrin repeat domain-containing protein 13C-like n=1 Tax=Symsagittifera roscoffensis TaxID=84072 RepID=UPI00307C4849
MGQNQTRDALASSLLEAAQEVRPLTKQQSKKDEDEEWQPKDETKRRQHTPVEKSTESEFGGTTPRKIEKVRSAVNGFDPFELTRDVFENNLDRLENVWKEDRERVNKFVGMRDIYGLTPVHLAFRLKREEYLQMFLHSASPDFFQRNETILDEAVNMGDSFRNLIKEVLIHQLKFGSKLVNIGFALLEKLVQQSNDFFCEYKWNVKTWIPLVSKYLPRDTITIYKKESCIEWENIQFTAETKRGNFKMQQ